MTSTDYFSDEHRLVRDSVKRFVEREILPHVDEWEEAGSFPIELYRKAGDAGILGIGHPEQVGGAGTDLFMKIVAVEEILRCTSGGLAASLGSLDIGLPPIIHFGSEALQQRIVPDVLAGRKIQCLAITEPGGGSDVAALRTQARRDGDHYVVNGSKTFITSGVRADYYTVAVRTGEPGHKGVSLLLVEKGTPGFSVGRNLKKMGWWASDTAELFFEDCRVPVENLIGEENAGFYAIMANFQNERLQLAVTANTTAQIALEETIAYVKQRQAFGQSLSDFQTLRHRIAEMATRVEVSREYTYRVAAKMQAGENAIKDVSMAKNMATTTSDYVTYQAVQLFGGMGYMRESVVERLYRDNRILSIGGGTYEIMNEVIAKTLGL
ncbi:acyl-CoA dehydrogenase family protein [Spongiibacter nanhainus]|uniref:Acyl-CoA dehydrogenase family protein n=1 Tax=Spongiibacter nanhainus TaxID=2794344 RepID=A0A7T4R2B4_9GAMM|nr:acyl-CoA dehydrogenase family protein [Spongiibacter nanhainus]QQD19166.1 acyl-CoA dehydrogenase family protein [Spongiibacter nanhainus]